MIPRINAFHDLRGGQREHRSLVIIAVSVQRIDTVMLPDPTVNLVFLLVERREIDQNGYRTAWNRPPPHSHTQSIALRSPFPIVERRRFFGKIKILLVVGEVGTDENNPVRHRFLQGFGPRREHCVNSSNFIANLPTRLKNVVGNQLFIIHLSKS